MPTARPRTPADAAVGVPGRAGGGAACGGSHAVPFPSRRPHVRGAPTADLVGSHLRPERMELRLV
jgi:hypothetical protein